MKKSLISKAANNIFKYRINNKIFNSISRDCIPQTEKEAYLIQKYLHKLFDLKYLDNVSAIKIGCTTNTMQNYLNIPNPCAGKIRSNNCYKSGLKLFYKNYIKPGVECELAVRLSSDINSQKELSDKALYECLDNIYAAIEIVDDRYKDWSKLSTKMLIADDFFSSGCVLGGSVLLKNIEDINNIKGIMYVNGKSVGEGVGGDILGHPLNALRWLIGRKDIIGEYLPSGTIVLLGSLVKTKWLKKGDEVKIKISNIGESKVKFI